MEPSGRNQWQPVANGPVAEGPESGKTVAVGCDRLPPGPHGKEEVDHLQENGQPREEPRRRPPISVL
jgi:hypothetical protein